MQTAAGARHNGNPPAPGRGLRDARFLLSRRPWRVCDTEPARYEAARWSWEQMNVDERMDAAVVAAAQAGDEQALDDLVAQYLPLV